MSSARLMKLLNPCSGTSLMLMIGMPSRSSRRAFSAMTCSRSGTTLTSIISRPTTSSSCSIRTCSSAGKRHVEVVDPLAARDLAGLVERAEDREPAVAQIIAAGAVVHEADDVIPELAVFEDPVRDEATEFPCARNQHALQADAGAPPALEGLAHELARGKRQQHVEGEEERPDDLRDLVRAAVLQLVGNVVRLEVQRGHDAEDHREDAADEDGEEVVDPRSAAPQPIEALDMERERHEHADERQHVHVLAERREALSDGNEAALEPDDVREHECRDAEDGVGNDVERDEQAVVPSYHRAPCGACEVWSMSASISRREALATEGLGVRARDRRVEGQRLHGAEGVGEGLGPVLADQHARHAIEHRLVDASTTEGDHRTTAGLGLDWHDPEILLAGQHHRRGAAIQVPHDLIGLEPEELDLALRARAPRAARDRAPGRRS